MKNIKMPKELADKWLEALRGGKYKQGFSKLHIRGHKGDTYCCLGVLQMVADGKTEYDALPTSKWLKNHEIVFLEEFGDPGRDPLLSSLGNTASQCNDSGLSFNFIADAIEDEIESTGVTSNEIPNRVLHNPRTKGVWACQGTPIPPI